MVKWLKSYRPTVRELLWFVFWIVVIAAVYQGARQYKYVLHANPSETPPGPTGTTNLHVDPPPTATTPKPRSVPPASATVAQPPVTVPEPPKPPPTPAPKKTYGTSARPKGWAPDLEETNGDARIVFPEEVEWLQQQLAKVQPTQKVAAEFQLAKVGQLTKQVGSIPYAIEVHGWGLPEQTRARNVGDCQDKSLLLATELIAAGVREVAICRGVGPSYKPGEPGHAWVQATVGGVLWRLESTNGSMTRAHSGATLDGFDAVVTVWNLAKH
ncbi:MAG: hypothetical protein ABIZ04_21925 [Opitutus sp.]